jgi:predicted RNase H-like HicB family nuclease
MEIAVVIHKDENSAYGVAVPDIPGCFSWGDTIEEAIKNTREAVEAHTLTMLEEGMAFDIEPSKIEDLQANVDYANGIWALVEIDFAQIDPKPERINVSIPRFALSRIDKFAESRHESRSGFLTRAALNVIAAESRVPEPA